MKRTIKIAAAAAAVLLAGGFGSAAAQAADTLNPKLEITTPITVGGSFTIQGPQCAPALAPEGEAPAMSLVNAEFRFGEGGESSWPGKPVAAAPNAKGWAVTATADRAGTYKVSQVCNYTAYSGSDKRSVVLGSGDLVVTGGNAPGVTPPPNDNSGDTAKPKAPALPAEPKAGTSQGDVTLDKVEQVNGVWQATLSTGTKYSGQTLFATLFSDPRSLGSAVVNAAGKVTFALPNDVSQGVHKLVLQRADGSTVGYAELNRDKNGWAVPQKGGGKGVANTGGENLAGLGIAGGVILAAGAGLVLLNRRRNRSVAE